MQPQKITPARPQPQSKCMEKDASVEALVNTIRDSSSDITITQLRALVLCFTRSGIRGRSPSDDDEDALPVPPPRDLCVLTREEFVEGVGSVLTQFTRAEMNQWFSRIDAD